MKDDPPDPFVCHVDARVSRSPTTRGVINGLAVNGRRGFFERKVYTNDQRAATRSRYPGTGHPAPVPKNWLMSSPLSTILHNVRPTACSGPTKSNCLFTIAAMRDDAGQ